MYQDLLSRIQTRVLVCDGATGTMLYAAGLPLDRLPPEANLSHPDMVRSIHRAYLAAGVDIIQTNTYGASRQRLARYGSEERAREINQTGVRLALEAREEAEANALIAGSVGPVASPGFRGRLDLDVARSVLGEQIEALVAAGVDLLVLETFGDLAEMVEAVQLAKSLSRLPIVAQMTFVDDNRTIAGDSAADVAGVLEELGVMLIGANCTLGPQGLLEVLRELARYTSLPLSAQPNAGLPRVADGRLRYTADGEYVAHYAQRFVEAGAALVGGCCGTTPEHMQAVARSVAELPPTRRRIPRPEAHAVPSAVVNPAPRPDSFAERLASGQFAVVCELQPLYGGDAERALRDAGRCREAGCHALAVAPSTSPRAQMSPATLALLLHQRLQAETLLTATTWDKSAMALQADLLGAYAFGIRNVICRTGTPPPRGDYPHPGVWDVDSVGLIEILRSLNEGRDANGIPIGKPTSFFVGARVNPASDDPEQELADVRRKVEAGAQFLITEPVYDLAAFFPLLDALAPLEVPVLLGVMPLRDFKHAEYLQHEVPGVSLPETIVRRMWEAGERGPEVGLEIARELVEAAHDRVNGILVASSSGSVVEMVQLLELLPRQGV